MRLQRPTRPGDEDNQWRQRRASCEHIFRKNCALARPPDLDIYRTATVLVKEYGAEQAPLMAAKRTDVLLDLGDADGQTVWKSGDLKQG